MADKNQQEVVSSFDLVVGEDTYASQTSQDASSARRMLSFIPSPAGDLARETNYATLGTTLPAAITTFKQFDMTSSNGSIVSFYFAVAGTTLYSYAAGAYTAVTAVGTLVNTPSFAVVNNQLHMDDGSTAWIFDGSTWVKEGFLIPSAPPDIVTITSGTLTINSNRFYWVTLADHTPTRPHESDSSPISAGTGPQTSKQITLRARLGTINVTNGSTQVTVFTGATFTQADVGNLLYTNLEGPVQVASVQDATHLTLVAPWPFTTRSNFSFGILPPRTTHIHWYASESENSQVGKLLQEVALPGGLVLIDQSPFIGNTGSLFNIDVDRPLRNDPPADGTPTSPLSGLPMLATHKYRVFRRRVNKPQAFYFSANEEVSVNANGAPSESYPGQDINTLSDIVNEFNLPDNSTSIRAMISHGDALYFGTERSIWPWFGESINDFSFSQHQVFSVGIAGPYAAVSTPYGLAFFSYDKKMYLYPSFSTPSPDSSTALVEIGRPMRSTFEHVDSEDLLAGNAKVVYYNYGRRNWLVFSYKQDDGKYRAWAFDFGVKAWFELQQGFTALAVFDFVGKKALVGGDANGNSWVIDDISGEFTAPTTCPVAIFRPALIDFGNPEGRRIFRYIEYEISNVNMTPTINFWLDPVDADNLPSPTAALLPIQMRIGANLFRAIVPSNVGSVCQRLMLEIKLPADSNGGKLRSVKLVADPINASQ